MATQVVFEENTLKVYVDGVLELLQPFNPMAEAFNADGTPGAWASEQQAITWYETYEKARFENLES